jgi:hypothetical protein
MSEKNEKQTSELSMDELEQVAGGDARVNNELENVSATPSAAAVAPAPIIKPVDAPSPNL